MKFSHFPKKTMVLLAGDIVIISQSYVISTMVFMWCGAYHGLHAITPLTGPLFLAANLFVFYLLDFYNIDLFSQGSRYLLRHVVGVAATAGLLALYFQICPEMRFSGGVFLLCLVMAGAGTYFWRWRLTFLQVFKKRLLKQKRLLIIGDGSSGETLYHAMEDSPDYHAIGLMTNDGVPFWRSSPHSAKAGGKATLRQRIKAQHVNVLVLATSRFKDPELLKAVLDCKLDGVMVYDMPSFYEHVFGKVPVEHVSDSWLIFTPLLGVKRNIYNTTIKRIIDILLSFAGLALTLPLALAIAAAIKLDSRGPVLYRQKRVGLNGELFTVLKFRSMQNGRDHERQHAGQRHDPRITRVGQLLRRIRLDELPQMWNVLAGHMSFIGPRALIESEVRDFEMQIPYFDVRHSVRPGITGWAQINYKHGATVEDGLEKLQYDLFYVKNLSSFLDILILLKTIKVVLLGKGAR